ncbi:unnamed protein product [Clonostachys solani]|uniref:Beta-lactamase-related domain-containing protein n=1 Tax=Clonostachys solani TaxID=160281 RepID=A0A9N9ZKU0_9HYPO|nr:unnamed protein product [Clonostachys solani]
MLYQMVLFTVLLLVKIPNLHALQFCPPLGPVFSQPTNVSTEPEGIAVADELSTILDRAIGDGNFGGNPFDPTQVSFSIVFTSVNDTTEKPAFEYHHTASSSGLDLTSASKATGDSIYRIGSVSKTFIPYTLLIERGHSIFNEPVTKYIPELQELALGQENSSLNDVAQVAWKEVTIGSLASHMSGLGETFAPLDASVALPDLISKGLPKLNESEVVHCGGYEGQPPCTKDGGIYASTNDLSAFIRSILKSTLLSPEETRAWLKPLAHTSDPKFSIGAPWEIRRLSLNSTSDGRIIDLYTKDGSLMVYYSKVVLIPDFGVTLAINVAGDGAGTIIKLLSELMVSKYVPALEAIARKQTFQKFGGLYTSLETNSSIRIEVDDGPGLAITSWINNGVDVLLETVPGIWGSPLFGHPRMYPTNLQNTSNGTSSASYRVIFSLESQNDGLQIFSDACSDWGLLDVASYGKVGLDDIVFSTRDIGEVVEVELRGFRKTLQRRFDI